MSTTSSPRQLRLPKAERRAQLLEAAHAVFSERGYHGTAMDAIAEAAQVSKPVLYQHFPGKRELYLALLDSELSALESRLVTAVSQTEDNRERVNATVRVFFEYVAQDSGAHRLIFASDLGNDADVSARLKTFEEAVGRAIGTIIEAQAGLPGPAAELLGHALAGAAQTGAMRWAAAPEVPLDTAVELVSRLAWRGIGQFPKDMA
ncbi:MAG: TetR/AcrR family transcriptional regulator [Arthrobacter sp.]|nr:TetR/AcrR family transcriptional regulator [Arthrobacter sp.]